MTRKTLLRTIKATFGRYIAILAIIALGVGFFTGLKSAEPAMRNTAEDYWGELRFYDFQLLSTLGLTEEDVNAFAALDGVTAAEGGYSMDALAEVEGQAETLALQFLSLMEESTLVELTAGRLPESAGECLADADAFTAEDIGKTITLSAANDEDTLDTFAVTEFTIVGVAQSSRYISTDRGSTSLGSGTLTGFVYLPKEAFSSEAYREILLCCDLPGTLYSEEYETARDEMEKRIKALLEERGLLRYTELRTEGESELADARQELDDGWAEYEDGKAEAEAELADAAAELADARQELDDGWAEYEDGKAEAEASLAAAAAELADARQEMDDGWADYEAGKAEAEAELADAEAQLIAAQQEIEDALAEVEAGEAQLAAAQTELEESAAQLASARQELEENEAQLTAARAQLEEGEAALDEQEATLAEQEEQLAQAKTATLEPLEAAVETLTAQAQALQAALDALEDTEDATELEAQLAEVQAQLAEAQSALTQAEEAFAASEAELAAAKAQLAAAREALAAQAQELEAGEAALTAGWAEVEAGEAQLAQAQVTLEEESQTLAAARAQLESGAAALTEQWAAYEAAKAAAEQELAAALAQLEEGEAEYADGLAEYEDGKAEAEQKLADALTELEDGEAEYADGLADYQEAKGDAEQELADALTQLEDGEADYADGVAELETLKAPTLYTLDRDSNSGYVSYENDIVIVSSIANAFPVFFALIAALVCITTMTRMVNEERTQIGTLKALGYGEGRVSLKYILYAGSAAVLGSIAGYFLGSFLLPQVIWMAYAISYGFAPLEYYFSPVMFVGGLLIALVGSVGVTMLVCRREFLENPADLIRPKAPSGGKHILLERFTPLWKHLSFLNKVTIRNTFRYKGRMIMMLVGIGGCTALLVTGYGIKDSVANLLNYQYDEIMLYDGTVTLGEDLSEEEYAAVEALLEGESLQYALAYQSNEEVSSADSGKEATVIALSAEKAEGLFDLHNGDRAIPWPEYGEAVLTEKLADKLGVQTGDNVTIPLTSGAEVTVTVSGICDNFLNHYVYLSEETAGEEAVNAAYYRTDDDNSAAALATSLRNLDGVTYVSLSAEERALMEASMSSLNYVVLLVVVCAGALAFIVLYNLTNINIMERMREVATLKVLGFHTGETASYVLRENIILSVLGGLLGLGLGKLLHWYVMEQVQVDAMTFEVRVAWTSYLYSFALTVAFALIANFSMRYKLDRINMAESLKSVE
ncbi:MAG: ABC transporter permease [Clostridiales bacterium]|nr:ABC transporter permease [Clostridiales bacterium]